jgi:hypothetical protein
MSLLSARWSTNRFGAKPVMVVGFSISTVAMLLLTQLSPSSTYLLPLLPASFAKRSTRL